MPWFYKYLPGNEQLREPADGGEGAGGSAGGSSVGDAGEGGNPAGEKAGKDKPSDPADKPKPDDEKAALIKDVMKWKDKAREGQTELEKLKAQVAELNQIKTALGEVSVDDLKGLVDQKKEAERLEAEKKGEYERIVAQMKEENQKRLKESEDKAKAAAEALLAKEAMIQSLTVGRAFSDSAFVRESTTLPPSIAQKEFGDYFDYEDGKLVAFDKPRGAQQRTKLVDGDGEPKSFEEAIEALFNAHPDAKSLLRTKRKTGGANSGSEPGTGKPPTPKLHGVQRIAAGLQKSS